MKGVALAVLALIAFHPAHAADRYVTPNGSTSSDCSVGTPCNIQRAADVVNPGETVLVADGTYSTGPGGTVLTINRGGNSTNKVTFKAMNKWGAKLWGQGDTSYNGVRVNADYVRLEGFDIYEFRETGIYNVTGDFFELVGNHIHHIARTFCSSDPVGRDGYYSQGTHDILIEGNQFDNVGRLLPGESGCVASVIRGDHALYMSGTNITVQNNIFYNMRTGWGVQLYPSASTNVRIYGNTFSGHMQADGGTPAQIVVWPACSGLYIKGNIFHQTRGYLVHMGNSTTTGEVHNNLTDIAISDIFDIAQPGVVVGGNILSTNPRFASVTTSSGVVSGIPDFHLLDASPAINAGLTLAGMIRDFDGTLRPQGGAYDIGCYERLSSGIDVIRPATIYDLGP